MLSDYYYLKKEDEKEKNANYNDIYQQILEYYKFHKTIETFFVEGFNSNSTGKKEEFYFIDSNWIINWKLYTNYDEVINNIDKNFDYLINKNILKKNFDYFPGTVTSKNSLKEFLEITLLKPRDFEKIINKKTYDLLNKFYKDLISFNFFNESIEGIFYEKMLVLFIDKYKRIKIIYKGLLENNIELVQLNIDFLKKDDQIIMKRMKIIKIVI